MGENYLTNPLEFLVSTLVDLYLFVLLLRFLLQMVRADFYNPLSQFIVKATNPVLQPLRSFIPPVARQDTAALVALFGIKLAFLAGYVALKGGSVGIGGLLAWSVADIIKLVLDLFFFAIIIRAILSWINPGGYNPAAALIEQITDPVMRPVQNIMPPLGGIDLSPIALLIGIQVLKMLVIPPLMHLVF